MTKGQSISLKTINQKTEKMENKKFNAKDFLKVSTLSPLETSTLKGGMADKIIVKIRIPDPVVVVVIETY